MKRIWMGIISIIIFILYIIASYISDVWPNILSSVLCFWVAYEVYAMIQKEERFKVAWHLFALIPVSWGVADLGWLLFDNFLGQNPEDMVSFTYAYLFPNIFMLLTVSFYLVRNIRRWHLMKLLLDVLVMFVVILGIGSAMIFSQLDYSTTSFEELVGLLVYVVSDLLTLLVIAVLVSSAKVTKVFSFLWIAMLGFLLYVVADLMYYFEAVGNFYIANSWSDILFMFSFVLLGFSALAKGDKGVLLYADDLIKDNENLFKTKLVLWISLVPIFLYIFSDLNIAHLALILLAIAVYQFVNVYVQRNFMMEQILKEKNRVQNDLEAMVAQRTLELEKINRELTVKSSIDALTGLYNRYYFLNAIEEAIASGQNEFSILYLDLNRFKVVNDVHGHSMGDEMLVMVAERFKERLQDSCLYARLGGDEFGVATMSVDTKQVQELATRIKSIFNAPYIIREYSFHIGVSIGVARYPMDADSLERLLQYSDIAMYHAKKEETNEDFVLYSSYFVDAIERRNHIELLLKEASYNEQFQLFYQPKFTADTKELIGMEALIRWFHPVEGFISPGDFIPIAEDTGMILPISDWVFDQAIHQIVKWNRTYSKKLRMSMNVSSLSLDTYDFVPKLLNLLKTYEVQGKEVELEITERSAMRVATQMEEIFTVLSNENVVLALDDFGTGYSSLSYIKQFDVDVIKIAKELVDNLTTDTESLPIINAIIMMAKGLGLSTIAEGVETQEQLAVLADIGCDAIQGYVLGRPVPADEFEDLYLRNRKS